MNKYFFTSESVSEGHPDKVADQISDAVLDKLLAYDPNSKVAVETLVTTGQVVLAGEVTSEAYVDLQRIARETIAKIGYNDSALGFDSMGCGLLSAIHEQSPDIRQGVVRAEAEEQGAGDQGMMFGYACNETPELMPLPLQLSHNIMRVLADVRKNSTQMPYLRPDAKAQVTVEYDSDTRRPLRIATIVVSTQHDEPEAGVTDEQMRDRIAQDLRAIVLPRALKGVPEAMLADYKLLVNPTGKFVVGGPHGDTGLTGRKIIVDTYGGRGAHGGGAFSGKDPSKVDRSATYMARYIAKNVVAAGIADEVLVQVAYAIGEADPVSFMVNTYGTAHVQLSDPEIAQILQQHFHLRPAQIIRDLKLLNPIYSETAAYGHMGREPQTVVKKFDSLYYGKKELTVELFTWEKTDKVAELKSAFFK